MASSSATEAASAGPPVYVASPKREETPKQDGLVKQRYIDQAVQSRERINALGKWMSERQRNIEGRIVKTKDTLIEQDQEWLVHMDEQEDVMFGSLETIEALLTGGPNPHITEDVVTLKEQLISLQAQYQSLLEASDSTQLESVQNLKLLETVQTELRAAHDAELGSVKRKLEERESECLTLRKTLDTMHTELEDIKSGKSFLDKEREELAHKRSQLEIDTLRNSFDKMKNENDSIKGTLETSKLEHDKRIQALTEECGNSKQTLQTAQQEVILLQKAVAEKSEENSSLAHTIDTTKIEYAHLKEISDSIQLEKQSFELSNQNFQKELASLKELYEGVQKENETLVKNVSEKQKELDNKSHEYLVKAEECDKLKTSIESCQLEQEHLKRNLDVAREECEALKRAREATNQEITSLQALHKSSLDQQQDHIDKAALAAVGKLLSLQNRGAEEITPEMLQERFQQQLSSIRGDVDYLKGVQHGSKPELSELLSTMLALSEKQKSAAVACTESLVSQSAQTDSDTALVDLQLLYKQQCELISQLKVDLEKKCTELTEKESHMKQLADETRKSDMASQSDPYETPNRFEQELLEAQRLSMEHQAEISRLNSEIYTLRKGFATLRASNQENQALYVGKLQEASELQKVHKSDQQDLQATKDAYDSCRRQLIAAKIFEENYNERLKLLEETMEYARVTAQSRNPEEVKKLKGKAERLYLEEELKAQHANSDMLTNEVTRQKAELGIRDTIIEQLCAFAQQNANQPKSSRKNAEYRPLPSDTFVDIVPPESRPAWKPAIPSWQSPTTKQKEREEQSLREQLEQIRLWYFNALVRAVKMQGSLLGWYSNINVETLHEEAMNEHVPIEEWPMWITRAIQQSRLANVSTV